MKSLFKTFLIFLFSTGVFAQSPQHLNYQAVVRNGTSELVINSTIGMRLQILKGSEFGAAAYVETHAPKTNGNGVIGLQIGTGTVVNGNFTTIDWSDGPYFLKSEIDPQGGTAYSINSTTQMVSVPYALYAQKAAEVEKVPSAFSVIGFTSQELPADKATTINFTIGNGSGGGTFIENNVFSLDTDEYTAPTDGIYFFESHVFFQVDPNNPPTDIYLQYSINNYGQATIKNYDITSDHIIIRLNTTIKLNTGDKVSLKMIPYSNGIYTSGAYAYGNVRMSGFKVN